MKKNAVNQKDTVIKKTNAAAAAREKTAAAGATARPMRNSGYSDAGASHIKKAVRAFNARSSSPQDDIDLNNDTLRQRARMLYMASPIAASAIKTNRTNVVGVGLKLESRVQREILGWTPEHAEEWQKKTELEFSLWADSKRACDATGVNNFYGIQQLSLVSWLLSGDCFLLIQMTEPSWRFPYSMRLHVVEADRVATPWGSAVNSNVTTGRNPDNGTLIYDGVEINDSGAVEAYHVRSNYPYEMTLAETKWTRIEAYQPNTGLPNVIHIMDAERPDQYRGVTYLAQVIEPILQLRRYTESEIMAALVESFFTAFIKTNADTSEMPFNETDEPPAYPTGENDYSLGPGTVNVMQPGEDVTFGDPKRPAEGFPAFVKEISKQIGAALEIPVDLLLKEFNASYSASRAALLEAWKGFKMRREWLTQSLCDPVYEIWMCEAVARGRIQAPGFFNDPLMRAAYLSARWIGPSQGQIDPVKEITAEIMACSEGFSTHEQSTVKLNGGNWDSTIDQLARENEKLNGRMPDQHQENKDAAAASLKHVIMDSVKDSIKESVKEVRDERKD